MNIIYKSCFVEPEIHKKLKRMPSGRKKLIEKKIIVLPNIAEFIESERIKVVNSSTCWEADSQKHIDVVAITLICRMLRLYQELGEVQSRVYYDK